MIDFSNCEHGRGEPIWRASAPGKGHNQKERSSPEAIRRLYSDGFTAGPAASPTRQRAKELLLTRRNVTLLLSRRSSAVRSHDSSLEFLKTKYGRGEPI
jgi:hypothetical protein